MDCPSCQKEIPDVSSFCLYCGETLKPPLDPHLEQTKLGTIYADCDWVAARILYLRRNPLLRLPAGVLGHNALEAYLKAFLLSIGQGRDWKKLGGYDLRQLGDKCASRDATFSQHVVKEILAMFTEVYREWADAQPSKLVMDSTTPENTNLLQGQLVALDKMVSLVRSRVRLADLGLPLTFKEVHQFSGNGGHEFMAWAGENNDAFEDMEQGAQEVNG